MFNKVMRLHNIGQKCVNVYASSDIIIAIINLHFVQITIKCKIHKTEFYLVRPLAEVENIFQKYFIKHFSKFYIMAQKVKMSIILSLFSYAQLILLTLLGKNRLLFI